MIVAGEEIVGKPIDKAIELVLKVENETGYLDNLSTVEFVNETSRYNSEIGQRLSIV